jgi:ABC-2 type transport system ATP-binding protein
LDTSSPVVEARDLWKVYERLQKGPGLGEALAALVRPRKERVDALRGISFRVFAGEILGYIGPNGAGKTTTLKILAGVLHPTKGEVQALGFVPLRRDRAFLRQMSFVMSGSGLLEEVAWDLSVLDGLHFVKELYALTPKQYAQTLEELVSVLQLDDFLKVPVRQLSHGQRARAELAAALLWQPRLLLLDEPTLGLDIMSQKALRDFIRDYVRRHHAACVITSHYMRDIEELADRLLLIDHGQLVAAGPPAEIVQRLSGHRLIEIQFEHVVAVEGLSALGRVVESLPLQATLEVPRAQAKTVAQQLLSRWPVHDLTIKEPGLEEALQRYFLGGGTQ